MSASTVASFTRSSLKACRADIACGLILSALLLFVPFAQAETLIQEQWVRPLSAGDLLALLPATPENWKLTASNAQERLSPSLAPETFAIREFIFVPPPPSLGATPLARPERKVRLTLIDTGNDPTRFANFTGFKADKPSSESSAGTGYLNLLVSGLPAIQYNKESVQSVTIAVSKRFLLFIRFTNLDDASRDHWLQLARVSQLAESSAKAPQTPLASGLLAVEAIDEFHPAGNYKSQMNFVTQADQDKLNQTPSH